MSAWRWINTELGAPAWNMAFDEALLESAPGIGAPLLRFYGWTEPAATFGYFQHYAEIAAWTHLRPLIRRPTGGGLVPHEADWTYSLVFPPRDPWYELRAVDSYRRLHEWIARGFCAAGIPAELAATAHKEIPGQCFAGAEQFDLLVNGRKIAGAAQRRTRDGLLIQGSIQPRGINLERARFEAALIEPTWEQWKTTGPFLARVDELAAVKYSQPVYNQQR